MRSNSRGSAPSLPPLSAPAPWPCPAPCLLALPRPPLPPFPGPLVPGPLSPRPRPPFTPPAYTSRSNTRGIPPTPSSPCRPLVPSSLGLWHARRTAPAYGLCPSTPALPPPPSPALLPLGHYAGHCVGKLQACRRHAPGRYRRRRRAGWHHAVAARSATAPAGAAAAGSHSKCRGGRGPGRPRLPPGQDFTVPPAAPGRRGGSITKSCNLAILHLAHHLYSGRRTARAAKEASRCGCPPLPQPPQEPLLRVAVPNAAGGAALAGPGSPPARVSLYPPRRLVAGGDPSKVPVRDLWGQ